MELRLPEGFLNDEVRDDFLIVSEMKRAWAASIKTLMDVARVCERHNITYYADYGTLLGAIRHDGYIPWDDDIDISVMRKDFRPLLEILARELPGNYVVASIYTQETHSMPSASILNRRRIDLGSEEDKLITGQYYGSPYGCGIDIFPIDKIPDDEELRDNFFNLYNIVYYTEYMYMDLKKSGMLDSMLTQIESMCDITFSQDRDRQALIELRILLADIAGAFSDLDCQRCALMQDIGERQLLEGFDPMSMTKETKWFEKTETHKFEYVDIKIPSAYDSILKAEFGDYMVKKRISGGHDYPFIRIRKLRESVY